MSEMKFASILYCKCRLFVSEEFGTDEEISSGKTTWQYDATVIITETNPTIQKRTDETGQKETFKTKRRNNKLEKI